MKAIEGYSCMCSVVIKVLNTLNLWISGFMMIKDSEEQENYAWKRFSITSVNSEHKKFMETEKGKRGWPRMSQDNIHCVRQDF